MYNIVPTIMYGISHINLGIQIDKLYILMNMSIYVVTKLINVINRLSHYYVNNNFLALIKSYI